MTPSLKPMPLVIVLIYAITLATVGIVLATRYHDPALLFNVTREDGPVEWATVFALLGLTVLLLTRLPKLPESAPKILKPSGYLLALLSVLAAGEEISWGQRLFGFETPEKLKTVNYQGEANLHNLVPAELFNGLIIFSVAIFFILIPLVWRKSTTQSPWWLPSQETSLLTISTVLVNHYRVSSLIEKVGLVLLVLILAWSTIDALRKREARAIAACALGWLTCSALYTCREILFAANHQYEIRELLVVLIVVKYCREVFHSVAERKEPRPGGDEVQSDSV